MRDFSTPRTFILSAARGINPIQDMRDHAELSCDLALEGIPFKEGDGQYKGKQEKVFVVVGSHAERAVAELARAYGQESYLCIAEHDRTAYEVNTETGYHKHLGRFRAVGNEEPLADAWTCVEGTYFTTDGRDGPDLPEGL